jgi:hypothetical protein
MDCANSPYISNYKYQQESYLLLDIPAQYWPETCWLLRHWLSPVAGKSCISCENEGKILRIRSVAVQ